MRISQWQISSGFVRGDDIEQHYQTNGKDWGPLKNYDQDIAPKRIRRAYESDPRVYLDTIEQLREIPNEYKVRD